MKKILISSLILVASCAGRRVINDFQGSSTAQSPGVITIRTGWLKPKKNSFDTELWFTNDSKAAIVVPIGKISCTQAGSLGSFHFVGYDSRSLELEPGEQRRFVGVCHMGMKGQGDWAFNFKDIAARTANGAPGKVLVANLDLKLVSAGKK